MSRTCRVCRSSLLLIVCAFTFIASSSEVIAANERTLSCKLHSTADYFIYYSSQLVYVSDDFALLHNFQGRVSTHIELETGKMIRSTFIGQPFDAHIQTLQGECFEAKQVIGSWLEAEK